MAEHPTTSADIESEIQDYDSTLANRTESTKSSVVTPPKIYKYILSSDDKTPLQKKPKKSCNK